MLDSVFDDGLLDQIVAEFPDTDIQWQRFDDERQKKLASSNEADMSPLIRHFLYELNSATFLRFLEKLTGIRGLISDPYFQGGGFHQIMPGGTLGVHTDFNKHPMLELDRRLNVIIFLNREWKEEYSGYFEMWDSDAAHCVKRVLPVFNRMVEFNTNDFSFHGHPEPLRCPAGMSRKSLALYYFQTGGPTPKLSMYPGPIFFLVRETARLLRSLLNLLFHRSYGTYEPRPRRRKFLGLGLLNIDSSPDTNLRT